MAGPGVVVIVPCVSLNPYVEECLRGCLALDCRDLRIALLPDEALELPARLRDERIRVTPTGDVSIAAKRNVALHAHPEAEFYAMIDSDAYPDSRWLRAGIARLAAAKSLWAVGGPNTTPPGEPWRQRVVGAASRSYLVSGAGGFCKSATPSRIVPSLNTCNLVVRGEVLRGLGGFDETLETAEDKDLCERIREQGGLIYFDREVVVFHHNRPLGLPLFLQRLTYGYWAVRICRGKRRLSDLPLLVPLAAAGAMAVSLALGTWSRALLLPGLTIFACYCGALLLETARHTPDARRAALTLLAIATANAGYLFGNLLALLGWKPALKTVYRNYPGGP